MINTINNNYDYNNTTNNNNNNTNIARNAAKTAVAGWHYLSNAICLIRPHAFYAFFVASRTTTICRMIQRF